MGTRYLDETRKLSEPAGGSGGTPSDTVSGPPAFGDSPAAGSATEYSRGDHSHGLPALPHLVGDTGAGGTAGIVPAPAAGAGADHKILCADASWLTRGWHTVYEVDFSSLGAQTLSGDGNYTIDGKVWTKYNSASGERANCTLNAVGLPGIYLYPAQTTEWSNSAFTMPCLHLPLAQLIPTWNWGMGIRVSAWNSYCNSAANYDRARLGIGPANTSNADGGRIWQCDRGWNGTGNNGIQMVIFGDNTNVSNYIYNGVAYYTNLEQMVLEVPRLSVSEAHQYCDAGATPYTTFDTTGIYAEGYMPTGSQQTRVDLRRTLGIMLGAVRAGSGTSGFIVAWKSLKVEVLFR